MPEPRNTSAVSPELDQEHISARRGHRSYAPPGARSYTNPGADRPPWTLGSAPFGNYRRGRARRLPGFLRRAGVSRTSAAGRVVWRAAIASAPLMATARRNRAMASATAQAWPNVHARAADAISLASMLHFSASSVSSSNRAMDVPIQATVPASGRSRRRTPACAASWVRMPTARRAKPTSSSPRGCRITTTTQHATGWTGSSDGCPGFRGSSAPAQVVTCIVRRAL